MSTPPPGRDPPDDADERYRRASERDPSRPSEATRRAVLAHAARLAAARTGRAGRLRRWLSGAGIGPGWRPAILGTLAAAVLAGVVIAPQLLSPASPPGGETQAAAISRSGAAAPQPAAGPAQDRAPAVGSVQAPPQVARERATRPLAAPASINGEPVTTAPMVAARAPPAPAAGAAADAQDAARRPLLGAQVTANASAARAVASVAALERNAAAAAPVAGDPQGLRQAAEAGDLTALTAQLASGVDVEARDDEGRTALMLAVLRGRADAVAMLLAHGADPSAADGHGITPMQAAIAADDRQIIAALRRYGAR